MRTGRTIIFITLLVMQMTLSCNEKSDSPEVKIIFLHHSTGRNIWIGDANSIIQKIGRKISDKVPTGELPRLFREYNKKHQKNYNIEEMEFPKASPYGWKNYPYDYYNIWVKNAGEKPYMEEPTLEILTEEYDIIIFKHCYPVSNIVQSNDSADINSEVKTVENYKLQYNALRDKLHTFPDKKFILSTGAVQVKSKISEQEARRAQEFFNWVIHVWDLPDDNIYLWDLYNLQTTGELYFNEDFAVSENDSHPNTVFSSNVAELLSNRIFDVIENNGRNTNLTGTKQ